MLDHAVTRRELMRGMAGAAAGLGLAGGVFSAASPRALAAEAAAPRRRVLRVGHLTDMHVEPELRADQGFAACLRVVQQPEHRPDLILIGGDCVFDSLATDEARTQLQWDLWKRTLKSECSIPVRACIGNHDVWGWNKERSKTTGDEPNWGKRRAVDMLQLDERYYTFDQAGWQFIVLDSTQPRPEGGGAYAAYLDDAQYDWLERTLRDAPPERHVLVMSHIPILSAALLMWSEHKDNAFTVNDALMHGDRQKLKDLFARHPNVKLCLSGHLHLNDRVDYNGVTYICTGAVSGAWWKGRHKDADEGFNVVDLYDDGTFQHAYSTYGWKAEPA